MTMTRQSEALFSVDTVARYLYHLKPDISPLKLQKSLYFLFAYYGAIYAQDDEDGLFEGTHEAVPKRLFNATFEAWQYGPVIRDVWVKDKQGEYTNPEKMRQAVASIESNTEVKQFIKDLFNQIDSVSDFTLVDRSHEDTSWKQAYRGNKIMDNDLIIREYVEKYVTEE